MFFHALNRLLYFFHLEEGDKDYILQNKMRL